VEGKLRKNSDKIEPFPIVSETNESVDDMDEALRQQLIKAADEYEKILNSDPSLDYIDEMEESPELFAAVIQKLKDEKKWVEEDEADSARKEEVPETAMGEEEKDNVQCEENREKVYNMLSDEDRKALAIGRKKMAQRRRDKVLKVAGLAAMISLCLFGVSMTSSANREYVISLWNSFASKEYRVSMDNGQSNTDYLPEEENSIQEISNQLGIKPIKFLYKPEGMKFLCANIDTMGENALMQYEYQDTIVNVFMYRANKEASANQKFDGEVSDTYTTTLKSQKEVEVKVIDNPDDEKMYAVEFDNENGFYSITAIMSREDFTNLLNNSYF